VEATQLLQPQKPLTLQPKPMLQPQLKPLPTRLLQAMEEAITEAHRELAFQSKLFNHGLVAVNML
jgi:hypothetical protein